MIAIRLRDFSHFFGLRQTLKFINLEIYRNEILGVIGPAGSGKSSFLRALNRLNDLVQGSRTQGLIEVEGRNIYAAGTSLTELRRRLGMVFATPVPLPRSIYENIVFGP
ncbi:MAG TPA: ATP-binding cassette domain-containing protein, partial [Acidobacteriota bacterium]